MKGELNKKALGMAQRSTGTVKIEISSDDYFPREIRNFNFKIMPALSTIDKRKK